MSRGQLLPAPRRPLICSRSIPARCGVTLVELLVTLVVLGLVAGVAGFAIHRAPLVPAVDGVARLAAARSQALASGRPVSIAVPFAVGTRVATALPDGSVLAEPALQIDRLIGRPLDGAP